MARKRKKTTRKERIKIKEKNFPATSKGRKGKYFYIKEIGKRPKYYKKKAGITRKDVEQYYRRGITSKRGGISKERIKKEIKLDKLQRIYPKIEDVLEKGYAEYTLENAERLTPTGIRTAYQYLLLNKGKAGDGKGIVRDKELLELITRSENIDKWKHRVLFEIQVKNEKGEMLLTINNTQVKHLGEIKKEIMDRIKTGQDYEGQYKTFGELEKKGYRINAGTTKSGKISNIKIKLIFRKGK